MNFDEKVRIFKAGWNAALNQDGRSPQSDQIPDFDVRLADALEKFVKDESKNPKGWDHVEKALAAVFGYEWPVAIGWIALVIVIPWACFFVQFRAWFVLFALITGVVLGINAFRDPSRERNFVLLWAGFGLVTSGAGLNFLQITSQTIGGSVRERKARLN